MSKIEFLESLQKQNPGIDNTSWKIFQLEEFRAIGQAFAFGVVGVLLEVIRTSYYQGFHINLKHQAQKSRDKTCPTKKH